MRVEQARCGERGVPNQLGGKAQPGLPGEEGIVGIVGQEFRPRIGAIAGTSLR